mmetsp:Transcript_4271/g.15743  ORF Transcript_4271/g.15743 Transcript_4271/m.15743 type:complete len:509 (-) Transcript_4271:75-1601(-)
MAAAGFPAPPQASETIDKPKDACQRMYALLESGLMSDVEIELDSGDRVKAHRCVLAVASPFFRDILESGAAETEEAGVVKLPGVDVRLFKKALQFLYTGWISLTNSDAATMLPWTAEWGTKGLRQACETTMSKHISVDNVCESLASAFKCGATELRDRCLGFVAKNGTAVLASDHWLTLPKPCVAMILQDGNLMVGTELEVFKAVLRWGDANKPDQVPVVPDGAGAAAPAAAGGVDADSAEAAGAAAPAEAAMRSITMREFLADLMPHVRFPTMSPDVIEDEVEPTEAVAPELVLEAYRQHARPPDRRKADGEKNPRLVPRRGAARRVIDPSKGRVLPYVGDFDTNGVIYYIGSGGGAREWSNPAEDGRIAVTRSSDGTGRAIDAAGRVGTKSYTDGVPNSWWQFDLGPTRTVLPSRYTLRHGSKQNTNVLRSWILEASNDGRDWTLLKAHKNDETLHGTGFATASWPIEDADQAFRHFRVRQTGPNSTGDDYLVLSGFELYGTLFES